ncbi:MAG TPA: HAMP domain-containing protein, partial [Friedmanniella sp.]
MVGYWNELRDGRLHRRLWLLTTAAVALAIVLSNVAGYVALRATLIHASQSVAAAVAADLVAPATDSLTRTGRLDAQVGQAGGVIVEAVRTDGSAVGVPGQTQELVLEPSDLAAAAAGGQTSRRTGVDVAGAPYVVVAVPLDGTGFALVTARPLGPVLEILAHERLILLCVIALSILTSAVVADAVARSGLRPVRQLTAAVEHVADTKDFQPIAIRYVAGDLATLAGAFNQLLRSI